MQTGYPIKDVINLPNSLRPYRFRILSSYLREVAHQRRGNRSTLLVDFGEDSNQIFGKDDSKMET